MALRRSHPGFRIWMTPVLRPLRNPESARRQALPALGQPQDADVVTASGEHESDVGVGEQLDLKDRTPRRDVVTLCAHREDRHANIRECYRPVLPTNW